MSNNLQLLSDMFSKEFNVSHNIFKDYIISFSAIGLTENENARNDINNIYVQNKFRYYEIAKNSTAYNHFSIKMGTLEHEIYSKKALGILLSAEEDEILMNKVLKLIRKYYKDVYNAVCFNKINFIEELKNNDEKYNEKMVSSILALYVFVMAYINKEGKIIIDLLRFAMNFFIKYEKSIPMATNIEMEMELDRAYINDIKSIIYNNLGEFKSFIDLLYRSDKNKDMQSIVENLCIINKLDINNLFSDQKYIDIDKVALSYIKTKGKSIDSDLIKQSMIYGSFIQSLINEYKRARDLYFQNSEENLLIELEALKEKNNSLKSQNEEYEKKIKEHTKAIKSFDDRLDKELKNENKINQLEISNLRKEINNLNNQLLEEEKYKQELIQLRQFIFNLSNNNLPREEKINLEEVIGNKKVVIVGGSVDWRKKLKEKYPIFTVIDGFNENFDINIFNNAYVVFFYTGFMNHATYYKIINYIRNKDIYIRYIGKTNVDLVEKEMINEMHKLEEYGN